MDPYSTHLEALVQTAMATTGAVLELGCGDYSTPVLGAICSAQGRRLLTQASNKDWASRFYDVQIVNWETWEPPIGRWGMVLLDNEESVKNRIKRLPTLAKVADVVVLHDADIAVSNESWPTLAGAFKSVKIYDKHKPWTAVLS